MNDPFDLKPHIGTVQDYPIDGITFRDITTLLETPSAFVRACDEMAKLCAEFNPTAIASIESRGFVFAGPLARDLGLPLVLARKPGKLPNSAFSREFDLEYGSTALEIQKNTALTDQDTVIIVDDLIATGGTAIACAELLNEHFAVAKQNILVLALIDLPALGGSKLIRELGFQAASLVSYD